MVPHGTPRLSESGLELVWLCAGDAELDRGHDGELAGDALFAEEASEETLHEAILLLVRLVGRLDPGIYCHGAKPVKKV